MLVLSTLHRLLHKVLDDPQVHTAVLLTPEGHLVSYAAQPPRPKDQVRVLVGLSGEVWQETKAQDIGMAESELGRILVLAVEREQDIKAHSTSPDNGGMTPEPLMLLALNGTDSADWDDLREKAQELADHLSEPISELRGQITQAPSPPPSNRSPRKR